MVGGIKGSDQVTPNKRVFKPGRGPGNFDDGGLTRTPEGESPFKIVKEAMARRKAEEEIERKWLRLGGPTEIGLLGKPLGQIQDHGNGHYTRNFETGTLQVLSPVPPRLAVEY